MFSQRIVTVDHYLAAPVPGLDPQYSTFRGAPIKRVPVLRIFGATAAGQKACTHIHGVFPYILVPYDGSAPLATLPYTLATALDRALNTALGHASANTQHVYKVTPVSGIPFYGYHSKEHQFLKIFFYSPNIVKKAAELLQNGVVQGRVFQPHEAHVPFVLQFLMDHNLHGMNMIHLQSCRFRQLPGMEERGSSPTQTPAPLPPSSPGQDGGGVSGAGTGTGTSQRPSTKVWTRETVPANLWLPETVVRVSSCEVEVDCIFSDILNRLQIGGGMATNPGLSYIWEDEAERQKEQGGSLEDLQPPPSPPRPDVTPSDSEVFYRKLLKEKLQAAVAAMGQTQESSGEAEAASLNLPALTPDDTVLAPATAPDTASQADVTTAEDESVAEAVAAAAVAAAAAEESQVDEELILSLTQQSHSQWLNESDVDLVTALAGLDDGSQVVAPEDHDAILSTQPLSHGSAGASQGQHQSLGEVKEEEAEEEETRHMTQQIWDSILMPQEEEEARGQGSSSRSKVEDGQASLLPPAPPSPLPQLDGATDSLQHSLSPSSPSPRDNLVPSTSAHTPPPP